jgi:hypothetical protein
MQLNCKSSCIKNIYCYFNGFLSRYKTVFHTNLNAKFNLERRFVEMCVRGWGSLKFHVSSEVSVIRFFQNMVLENSAISFTQFIEISSFCWSDSFIQFYLILLWFYFTLWI